MKILIIEDSERIRKSLAKGFSELGFVVDSTGDGHEGLHYARSFNYEVIVLDIMLPSLDGMSLLKELRQKNIAVNVIILSAKDQLEDRIRGLNLGADDYLCKPFSFDELHARVLTLVRRSHQLKSNTIAIGDVFVDIGLKQVAVANTEIQLTPLEYSILEQLALNLNKVLSPENLVYQLHDSRADVSKNSLEVHISAIRKKMKALGIANGLIETKRSFGYVIRKPCTQQP